MGREGQDSGRPSSCSADTDRPSNMAQQQQGGGLTFPRFVKYYMFLMALLTILLGVGHVANSFEEWCDSDNRDCVGPWLIWNSGDNDNEDFIDDNNEFGWRTIFTLRPDFFFDIWTPLFGGLILLSIHFTNIKSQALAATWPRVILLHLVITFFAVFGYEGNMGVLLGFLMSLAMLLQAVAMFSDDKEPTLTF